jgi:hypothetical protein
MWAMIGDAKRRSEGFSGFPAGSLPDPRFLPIVGPKSMISGDFFGAGGTPINFYPEFSRAAGKPERRRYPCRLPPLWDRRGQVPGVQRPAIGGCCSCRCLSFRAKKRFGEQPAWPSRNGRQERYLTGPIGGIVSTAELSSSICRRCSSGCAAFSERSIDPELAPPSSPSRSLPKSRS